MEHRMPPCDIDAEKAFIGCLLLDNKSFEDAEDSVSAEDFYLEASRKIFNVFLKNYKTNVVDIVTISSMLGSEELDSVGGISHVASLVDNVPSTSNIKHYAKIVKDMATKRNLLLYAHDIVTSVYDHTELSEIINTSQQKILEFDINTNNNTIKSAHDVAKETFIQIEKRHLSDNKLIGLPTGLVDLDDVTAGLVPGELTIIAGRPSMGKSCLAGNIACECGKNNSPAIIFSIEMPNEMNMIRFLAAEAKIEARQIRKGFIQHSEWPKLTNAAGIMGGAAIYFDDSALLTTMELRVRARKAKKDYGIKLLVLDYLQLMTGNTNKSREREVADISSTLKSIARELNISVIGVSQLNRNVDSRPNKRPLMSDLRECVVGDTLIDCRGGKQKIKTICKSADEVKSFDIKNDTSYYQKPLKAFFVGEKECLTIKTKSGKIITLGEDTPLLTKEGWVKAKNLKETNLIYIDKSDSLLYDSKKTKEDSDMTKYKKGHQPEAGFKKGSISPIKGLTTKPLTGRKRYKGLCMNTGRTHFKKGFTPWNKGLTAKTNPILAQTGRKVSILLKGRPAPKPENFSEICRKANPPREKKIMDGYVFIYKPGYEGSKKGKFNLGRIAEHKYVVEQKIGRILLPNEEVHHWNGIKGDNGIENLRLCTKNEHSKIHHAENKFVRKLIKEGRVFFDETNFEFRLR